MAKVLCIGHSAYDLTISLDEFPIENRKYSLEKVLECGGGPAGNAAYLLAKWGIESSYAGVLGNDMYGLKLKQEYEEIGVNLNYLVFDDNCITPFSFIIANKSNGSRTLFNHYNRKNPPLQIEFSVDNVPDVILTDGYEAIATMKAMKKYPNAKSVFDAGSYNPTKKELAGLVDYLVCSEDFAKTYTGISSLDSKEGIEEVFRILEELNNKNIVITIGEKGSLYKMDGQIINQPVYKVDAVDTTGAGDIFHGAFAYCLAKGFDIVKTVKISSIAAALSVQTVGGRVSIPELGEVLKLYGKNLI